MSELGVGPGGELELHASYPPQPPKGVSPHKKSNLEKPKTKYKENSPQNVVDQTIEGDPPKPVSGEEHAPPHYVMPSAFTVQVQSGGHMAHIGLVRWAYGTHWSSEVGIWHTLF